MVASSGVASTNISTAGTTKVSVIRCFSTSASMAAGSMSRRITEWPPRDMPPSAHPVPPMWKRGMATSETVSAVDVEHLVGLGEDGGDVPAGDHDALGQAGGPRGVELDHHVVGARLEPGVGRIGVGVGVEPVVEPVEGHPAPHRVGDAAAISLTASPYSGAEEGHRSRRCRPGCRPSRPGPGASSPPPPPPPSGHTRRTPRSTRCCCGRGRPPGRRARPPRRPVPGSPAGPAGRAPPR